MENARGRDAISNRKEEAWPRVKSAVTMGVVVSLEHRRGTRRERTRASRSGSGAKRRTSSEDEGAEAPSQTNYAARLIFSSFFSTIARFNRER